MHVFVVSVEKIPSDKDGEGGASSGTNHTVVISLSVMIILFIIISTFLGLYLYRWPFQLGLSIFCPCTCMTHKVAQDVPPRNLTIPGSLFPMFLTDIGSLALQLTAVIACSCARAVNWLTVPVFYTRTDERVNMCAFHNFIRP